jgi:hypothetical protein
VNLVPGERGNSAQSEQKSRLDDGFLAAGAAFWNHLVIKAFTQLRWGQILEVQMTQYDKFRDDDISDLDDDISDKVGRYGNLGRSGKFQNEWPRAKFSIGVLIALAVVLVIGWNMGYVQVEPSHNSTNVTDLPITPNIMPTPQPQPPNT